MPKLAPIRFGVATGFAGSFYLRGLFDLFGNGPIWETARPPTHLTINPPAAVELLILIQEGQVEPKQPVQHDRLRMDVTGEYVTADT